VVGWLGVVALMYFIGSRPDAPFWISINIAVHLTLSYAAVFLAADGK